MWPCSNEKLPEIVCVFAVSLLAVSDNPTYQLSRSNFSVQWGTGFCGFGAQWSNRARYAVAPCGVFCPMEQWRTELS